MHISEGVLSAPVLLTGAAFAAAGVAVGLKKMDYDQMPKTAMLSSAFFVASLIHVPLGPASVHLVLGGLMGLLLGWAAFPAILVALALQAVLFQYGGLTTLGINTLNMALPALLCFWCFRPLITRQRQQIAALGGFLSGFCAVGLSGLMVALSLVSTGEGFVKPALFIVGAHLPVMVIEGIITSFVVLFLRRVEPEMLEAK